MLALEEERECVRVVGVAEAAEQQRFVSGSRWVVNHDTASVCAGKGRKSLVVLGVCVY